MSSWSYRSLWSVRSVGRVVVGVGAVGEESSLQAAVIGPAAATRAASTRPVTCFMRFDAFVVAGLVSSRSQASSLRWCSWPPRYLRRTKYVTGPARVLRSGRSGTTPSGGASRCLHDALRAPSNPGVPRPAGPAGGAAPAPCRCANEGNSGLASERPARSMAVRMRTVTTSLEPARAAGPTLGPERTRQRLDTRLAELATIATAGNGRPRHIG